jgi:hypothetical protein
MTADEQIEAYLRSERRSSALRLLAIAAIALVLGGAGCSWLWIWLTDGGVIWRPVLAAPFAFLTGAALAPYAIVRLLRR